MREHPHIHHLKSQEKDIILIGTAHVSKESAQLVTAVIEEEKPDTVSVELCESRYQSVRQKDRWQEMDIIKVIKEKKAFLLLSNLMLASFQRRIAQKLDIRPGEEMIKAIETAEQIGAAVHLADRDIRTTLHRTWRLMGTWDKFKAACQLLRSLADVDDITEADVERMKQEDMLELILADVGKSFPIMRTILIDERDRYLAQKIKTAPGNKIVAVVGAGHVPGIRKYWEQDVDMSALEQLPPTGKYSGLFQWVFPALLVLMMMLGFFYGGTKTGTHLIIGWVLATSVLSGLGAMAAWAHPITIVSAIVSAPIAALHPLIAAGWISGLVEAVSRKPKVKDFEALSEDIGSLKGFWKNRITRILLVVVFTNIGCAAGNIIGLSWMVKILA